MQCPVTKETTYFRWNTMKCSLFLIKNVISLYLASQCWGMKGYNFEDNKSSTMTSPDDGFLLLELPGLLPATLSVCWRFYTNFNRFGDQVGVVQLFTPNDKWPVFNVYCRSVSVCRTTFHGTLVDKGGDFPRRNWLRKWSSICVGLDFLNNEITASFNGEKINRTELETFRKEKGNPLTKSIPTGYFEGNYKKYDVGKLSYIFHREE